MDCELVSPASDGGMVAAATLPIVKPGMMCETDPTTEEATALLVACLLDGVARGPAVRCRSDAAGRFVPVLDGVGMPLAMPADGEGSIWRRGEAKQEEKEERRASDAEKIDGAAKDARRWR